MRLWVVLSALVLLASLSEAGKGKGKGKGKHWWGSHGHSGGKSLIKAGIWGTIIGGGSSSSEEIDPDKFMTELVKQLQILNNKVDTQGGSLDALKSARNADAQVILGLRSSVDGLTKAKDAANANIRGLENRLKQTEDKMKLYETMTNKDGAELETRLKNLEENTRDATTRITTIETDTKGLADGQISNRNLIFGMAQSLANISFCDTQCVDRKIREAENRVNDQLEYYTTNSAFNEHLKNQDNVNNIVQDRLDSNDKTVASTVQVTQDLKEQQDITKETLFIVARSQQTIGNKTLEQESAIKSSQEAIIDNQRLIENTDNALKMRIMSLENVTSVYQRSTSERLDSIDTVFDSRLNNVITRLDSSVGRQNQINFVNELQSNATNTRLRQVSAKVDALEVAFEALTESHIDLGNLSANIAKTVRGFEADAQDVANTINNMATKDEIQQKISKIDSQFDMLQGVFLQFGEWAQGTTEDVNKVKSQAEQLKDKVETNTNTLQSLDTVIPRLEKVENQVLDSSMKINQISSKLPEIDGNSAAINVLRQDVDNLSGMPSRIDTNEKRLAIIETSIKDLPDVRQNVQANQESVSAITTELQSTKGDLTSAKTDINTNTDSISQVNTRVESVKNDTVTIVNQMSVIGQKANANSDKIDSLESRLRPLEELPVKVRFLEILTNDINKNVEQIQTSLYPKIEANEQNIATIRENINDLPNVRDSVKNNTKMITDILTKTREIDDIKANVDSVNRRIDEVIANVDNRLTDFRRQLETSISRQNQINFVTELRSNTTKSRLNEVSEKVDALEVALEALAESHIDLGNLSASITNAIKGFEVDAQEAANIINNLPNRNELEEHLSKLESQYDLLKGVVLQFGDWAKATIEDINKVKAEADQIKDKVKGNTDTLQTLDTVLPRLDKIEKDVMNNTKVITDMFEKLPKMDTNDAAIKSLREDLNKLSDTPQKITDNSKRIDSIEDSIKDLPDVRNNVRDNKEFANNVSISLVSTKDDLNNAKGDIVKNDNAISEIRTNLENARNDTANLVRIALDVDKRVGENINRINAIEEGLVSLKNIPSRVQNLEFSTNDTKKNVESIKSIVYPKIDASEKEITDIKEEIDDLENLRNAVSNNTMKIGELNMKTKSDIDSIRNALEQNNMRITTLSRHITAICQRVDIEFAELGNNVTTQIRALRDRVVELEKQASAPKPSPWVPTDEDKSAVDQMSQAIGDLHQSYETLKTELDSIKKEAGDKLKEDETKLDKLVGKVDNLDKTHKTDIEATRAKHTQDMDSVEIANTKITSDVDLNKAEIQSLRRDISQLNNTTKENSVNIEGLQIVKEEHEVLINNQIKALEGISNDLNLLNWELQTQNKSIELVENEMKALKDSVVDKDELSDIMRQIEEALQKEFELDRNAMSALGVQIQAVQKVVNDHGEALERVKEQLITAISGLNITVEELKANLDNLEKTSILLAADQRQAEREIRDLINHLHSSVSTHSKALEALKAKLDDIPDKAEAAEVYSSLQRSIVSTRTSVTKQQGNIMALFGHIARLTSTMNELTEEINKQLDNTTKKDSFDVLASKVKELESQLNAN